jgi:hypothetical protein
VFVCSIVGSEVPFLGPRFLHLSACFVGVGTGCVGTVWAIVVKHAGAQISRYVGRMFASPCVGFDDAVHYCPGSGELGGCSWAVGVVSAIPGLRLAEGGYR